MIQKPVLAAGITFHFTLDNDYKTSAGVYNSSNTLVRTLWRKVSFSPGTYTKTWDGKDDYGAAAPDGTYTVKVLYHNMSYVWDGVIGNTSASFTDYIYRSSTSIGIIDLALAGSKFLYVTGFEEGSPQIHSFSTSDIGHCYDQSGGSLYTSLYCIATDDNWYYVANGGCGWDKSYTTFVTAYRVKDNSPATFANGKPVDLGAWNGQSPNGSDYYASCVDVITLGAKADHYENASGLAVQKTGQGLGTVLAVAHDRLNEVRCFDKTTGAALPTIKVAHPGRLAFAPNGDLWVISNTSVIRYTSVGTNNTVATTITTSLPLAVAVHPTDNNKVYIVDGGSSQQIKCYTSTGAVVTSFGQNGVFGQAGGYASNPTVVNPDAATTAKFHFVATNSVFPGGFIVVLSDGSFWVRDGGNSRTLHINPAKTPAYIEQIAVRYGCQYAMTCNPNAPGRLFDGWLEYEIDYSKPLQPGDPNAAGGNGCWKLKRNWGAGVPDQKRYYGPDNAVHGFNSVADFGGRTFALAQALAGNGSFDLVELPSSGVVRFTGINTMANLGIRAWSPARLYDNGDLRWNAVGEGRQAIYKKAFTELDGNNNPQWTSEQIIAMLPAAETDPYGAVPSGIAYFPMTSTNVVVSLNGSYTKDSSKERDPAKWRHLGGVAVGDSSWLWKASPGKFITWPYDGLGSFPNTSDWHSQGLSANGVWTAGRNIVYGFNGNGCNATNMHFYDDGLFVGQFTPSDCQSPAATNAYMPPKAVSNPLVASLVQYNGVMYLYMMDEGMHGGVHRWRLTGGDRIREATGSGTLNSTVSLTASAASFPTGLGGTSASNNVTLTWQGVSGAGGYNVKKSTTRCGPYTTVATAIVPTTYLVTGLTSGVTYYFVVSATVSGVESVNSDEAQVLNNNGAVAKITFPSENVLPSNSYYAGDNLNDGKLDYPFLWATMEGCWQDAAVTFDLGKQYTVSRLNIYNWWNGSDNNINRCWKTYEIYVYDDPDNKGSALANDKPTLSQSLTGPALNTVNITTPKRGRLVLLKMLTLYSSPNPPWDSTTGLNEVEIYGVP